MAKTPADARYDVPAFVVLVVGFWEGLLPLAAAAFGWTHDFWLALPLQLPRPGAIVVGAVVTLLAVAVIWWLDVAKRRAHR